MRIDSAVSLCDRARFIYAWAPHRDYTAEDLGAILARNRFDGAIVSAQTSEPAETDWLLGLAACHPWMLGVIAHGGDPNDWDRWQCDTRFLGVDAAAPSDARELERRGLVCRLRPGEAIEALALASALRVVVRAMDGLRFDLAAEFEDWSRALEVLRPSPAVMQVDRLLNFAGAEGWRADKYRPWVQHVLSRFGPGRVAYGSGWPLSMPHATWKESLACFTQAMGAQTLTDRGLILGENALKFYRPPSSPVRYTE